jgi:F-type H+-transporting ATPase subunit alpha
LTARLFDPVALDQMTAAQLAVQQAATHITAEVRTRLETADKLTDEDREAIVEVARAALTVFGPKPELDVATRPAPAGKTAQEPKRTPGPDLKPKAGSGHGSSAGATKAAAS